MEVLAYTLAMAGFVFGFGALGFVGQLKKQVEVLETKVEELETKI